MSDLEFLLDLGPIQQTIQDVSRLDSELKKAAQLLAGQAHLKIVELAQARLHARREMYLQNLTVPKEIAPGVYVITLDAKADWIESGRPPGSMLEDLLRQSPNGHSKSGPKHSKDGGVFRVIPFLHNKGGPTSQTPAQQTLTATIRSTLRNMKVPYGSIERNPDGSPKIGLLHELKIPTPNRPEHAQRLYNAAGGTNPLNKQGYGSGDIGKPMQGPTGIPFLQGARIYQSPLLDKDGKPKLDSKGRAGATKSIITFRIASSKFPEKWITPGTPAVNFFDEARTWAEREFDTKICPEILKKLGIGVTV